MRIFIKQNPEQAHWPVAQSIGIQHHSLWYHPVFLTVLKIGVVISFMFGWQVSYGQGKTLLNLNRKGVILDGYDPVAFYAKNKPVKGSEAFQYAYKGAIYYFESAANQAAFEQEPAKYEPQFGGYCAYAVSLGKTASIDVRTFSIVHNRLLFQYDEDVAKKWQKDVEGNLKKADQNWPKLLEEDGK